MKNCNVSCVNEQKSFLFRLDSDKVMIYSYEVLFTNVFVGLVMLNSLCGEY